MKGANREQRGVEGVKAANRGKAEQRERMGAKGANTFLY